LTVLTANYIIKLY